MNLLKAFRWTLAVSISVYIASFALIGVDPGLALLVGFAATVALAASALGCLVTQIAMGASQRKRKSVEKPE
jgi:hypothetical protein